MRFLFNLFAFLSVLTFLLFAASAVMEFMSDPNAITFEGTSMTMRASDPERIFLAAWLLSMMFAWYFWTKVYGSGRKP
jgi:hypothetical protein